MSELQALKALSKAKESEEKRLAERRRNLLVLILRHLVDHGYVDSYDRLSTETNLSLNKVCLLSFFTCAWASCNCSVHGNHGYACCMDLHGKVA